MGCYLTLKIIHIFKSGVMWKTPYAERKKKKS